MHPDSKINPAFIDLTGVRFGRMTVLGLNADRRGKRGEAIWNCRCACGAHEIRKSKAIKNPENRGDRCTACRAIAQARHSHAFRTTGRGLDVRDI